MKHPSVWLSLLLVCLALLTAPQAGQALAGPEIESLEIELLPEFDRPDVLVVYRITFLQTEPLPSQITLRIPRAAEKPYVLQFQNVDGMMDDLSYTLDQRGDRILISFSTPTPTVTLSYYDPGLRRSGNRRAYSFMWLGDYRVRDLNVRIMQPTNTDAMEILPVQGEAAVEPDGLTYYTLPFGTWEEDEILRIQFAYEKFDEAPAVMLMSVESAVTLSDNPADIRGAARPQLLIVIIVVVSAVLLVAGLLVWLLLTRGKLATGSMLSLNRQALVAERSEEVYCAQCGRRAQEGDVFCRVCGARLRGL